MVMRAHVCNIYLIHMVNTRRTNQGDENLSPLPPPPITMEQLLMMQTKLMQQMAQNIQNLQNNGNGNGNGNAPPQARDKRGVPKGASTYLQPFY
jgi:hypothetical protein